MAPLKNAWIFGWTDQNSPNMKYIKLIIWGEHYIWSFQCCAILFLLFVIPWKRTLLANKLLKADFSVDDTEKNLIFCWWSWKQLIFSWPPRVGKWTNRDPWSIILKTMLGLLLNKTTTSTTFKALYFLNRNMKEMFICLYF